MKILLRIVILIFNVLLYNTLEIENIDIFVSNLIILNILSFVLLIYFDDYKRKNIEINCFIKNETFIKNIILELTNQFKNVFNWIVFLFPLFFCFITKLDHFYSEKEIIFFTVMILLLKINIIALSLIIKIKHHKKYFVYILISGVILQLQNIFFNNNFQNITIFLIGLTLITYIYIVFELCRVEKNKI